MPIIVGIPSLCSQVMVIVVFCMYSLFDHTSRMINLPNSYYKVSRCVLVLPLDKVYYAAHNFKHEIRCCLDLGFSLLIGGKTQPSFSLVL